MAVDLERLVRVQQIRLEFSAVGRHRFVIEASRDRATWTVIADQSGPSGTSTSRRWHLEVPEAVALQVRVHLLPVGGLPYGVTELSVMGCL
ncbi:hypothetical protein [Streptomyces sp. NPDC097640]|uniref:hypothetical protein n=1 Tax=Streptomyces sp. NPDC097640 TaxID=3157229 RepID=UPI00331A8108